MIKNKLLKLTISAVSLSFIAGSGAFAAVSECTVTHDADNNKIIISGTASGGEVITVQVLRDGYVLYGLTDENREAAVAFVSAAEADQDGKFDIKLKLDKTGVYKAYLTSKDTETVLEYDVFFTDNEEYSEVIGELNAALSGNDKTAFVNLISQSSTKLGFSDKSSGAGDFSEAAELYYNECKKNGLTEDFDKNAKTFAICLAITALNKSELKNAYSDVEEVLTSDSTMNKYAEKHIKTETAQEFFTTLLSGKNISGLDVLKSKCEEALILTAVRYPDGNINIKDIFEDYKSLLGISTVASSGIVYNAIGGKSYNSISALKSAYQAALNSSSSGTTGGGGGGGGSGSTGGGGTGKSIVTSSGISSITAPSTSLNDNPVSLKIKFDDLDSVDWAYSDIAELYEKGIISGESEARFNPLGEVTREQFIKMIVCAMGIENIQAEYAGFSDVPRDAWFEKYISVAKAGGLVSGIGDNLFGTGMDITRQDMAVMLYNAMCKNGFAPTGAVNSFEDRESCGDYAVTAIAELAELGIINGVGDNLFDPTATATRAQAAVIINRALSYLK